MRFGKFIFPLIITLHLVLGIIWLAIAWGVAWALFRLATSPAKLVVKFRKTIILAYPWAKKLDWSIDNYGPYVIPYKGMVLAKSSESLRRYGPILAQENPGKKIDGNNSEYCFEHDYFFMMGDNFHDSEDSRYYGPVKEELLIGKASFILFSKSDKYERMKRIFCNLN